MVDMDSKVHPWEAEIKYMFDRKGINFGEVEQFFQEKRDLYLGRWRWPENPDYVVYQACDDRVLVVDEETGNSKPFRRFRSVFRNSGYDGAARAYFLAHPEPKPWHDAKPGEVWVFTIDGFEFAAVVGSEYEVTDIEGKYNLTDFRIESAYKVYPVEEE